MSDDHKKIITAPAHGMQKMHPLVESALSHGGSIDPATMGEMLKVQREWEAGEAKKAYNRAMVALKRELPTVLGRDKKVEFATSKGTTSYQHTTLAAAVDAVTEPLTKHGFSVSWTPKTTDRNVEVTCSLTHEDGHSESTSISAPPDTSGSKSPAQAVASTITLLQRYTMLSLLGIATRDHVDPEPADKVDTKSNLAAVAGLRKEGIDLGDAEKHVGRPMQKWTTSDLSKLRQMIIDKRASEPEQREPGQEG